MAVHLSPAVPLTSKGESSTTSEVVWAESGARVAKARAVATEKRENTVGINETGERLVWEREERRAGEAPTGLRGVEDQDGRGLECEAKGKFGCGVEANSRVEGSCHFLTAPFSPT